MFKYIKVVWGWAKPVPHTPRKRSKVMQKQAGGPVQDGTGFKSSYEAPSYGCQRP